MSEPQDDDGTAPLDPASVEGWARSHLDRFPSSAENLRRVLLRRARRRGGPRDDDATAIVDAVVARCRAAGLIDDVAYAAARARSRARRGQSRRTIRAGLAAKGVAEADMAAALAALDEGGAPGADPDLAAACAFARRRRLGPFRAGPADAARELAAFARAGFTRAVAEAVLGCADPGAVASLLCREE